MNHADLVERAKDNEALLSVIVGLMERENIVITGRIAITLNEATQNAKVLRQLAMDLDVASFASSQPITTRKAVDEIIDQEKRQAEIYTAQTMAELTTRNAELLDTCQMIQKENTALKNINSQTRDWIGSAKVSICQAVEYLGGLSGQTHRDKDEGLLHVVKSLLNIVNRAGYKTPSHMDDIPF